MSTESHDGTNSGLEHSDGESASATTQSAAAGAWRRDGLVALGCLAVGIGIAVPAVQAANREEAPVTASAVVTRAPSGAPAIDIWPDAPPQARVAAAAGRGAVPAKVKPNQNVQTRIVSQSEVLRLVQANFPANEVNNAMAVASCESGQQSIVGETNGDGTTDWGVFQLNDGGTLQGAMARIGAPSETSAAQLAALDAATNIRAAAAIFADRGWSPWVCAYKQQIVAQLYTNVPGPMYGKFTLVGGAMPALLTQEQAAKELAAARARAAAAKRRAQQAARAAAKRAAAEEARRKAASQSPKPSPTKSPTSTPTPSKSASPSVTPTATVTPTTESDQ